MLVGCLAIMGAGVPFSIYLAFSGHYSKDAILAQALSFTESNPTFGVLFYVAAGGAAITAFYMFRLWFMTFAGEPRDHHVYDHAHESPRIMYYPLVALSVFAIGAGWNMFDFGVQPLLEQARPAGIVEQSHGQLLPNLVHPSEHDSHLDQFEVPATLWATGTALTGFLLAVMFYGLRILDPNEVRNQFRPIYDFLMRKWYFDELYNLMFVQPVLFVSRRVAEFDKKVIDRFIDSLALSARMVSHVDDLIDRYIVDGFVNVAARWIYGVGEWFHNAQTGKIRQYVMFIVIATVALFVLISFYSNFTLAGP
jgi:NADH-quinone oxidoreductase subunit L